MLLIFFYTSSHGISPLWKGPRMYHHTVTVPLWVDGERQLTFIVAAVHLADNPPCWAYIVKVSTWIAFCNIIFDFCIILKEICKYFIVLYYCCLYIIYVIKQSKYNNVVFLLFLRKHFFVCSFWSILPP